MPVLLVAGNTGCGSEDDMVAGDSRRIVVIKNIASNLIEEAILILRSGPDETAGTGARRPGQSGTGPRNDFLLREAERIINDYMKEHGLAVKKKRRLFPGGLSRFRISVDSVVNIMLAAAVLLLLVVISRMM
jgi:hypothetical protein